MGSFSKTNTKEKELKGQSRYIKNVPDTKPIVKIWDTPKKLQESFIRLERIHGRLCALEDDLLDNGEVIIQDDKTVRNPSAITYKELFPQYLRLAEKFGLTPYDRKRIDLPTDDNPNDSTREFLGL